MPSHDPRTDFEHLRAEDLYAIATNEAAAYRDLAIQILVERGSLFALKDEIAEESRQYVLDNPLVLRKIDPASAVTSIKMPGVIECIADAQQKRQALAKVVAEQNAAHAQHFAAVEAAVIDHKVASDRALRDACVTLWKYVLHRAWRIDEDSVAQKIAFDGQISELRAEHERDIATAAERLRLLERSPWRKLADWLHARWSRLRRKPDLGLVETGQPRLIDLLRQIGPDPQ